MNTFATDSYTIIRGLVDPEWCRILYDYVRYSAMRSEIKQHNDKERYHEAWDGTFNDKQCPGSYSNYGIRLNQSGVDLNNQTVFFNNTAPTDSVRRTSSWLMVLMLVFII